MPNQRAAQCADAVRLPANAPKVRITAGLGSVNQKTWVLRRAATLIGSGRQAHIVLQQPDVSRAHCLIVNTGTAILLKDLNSQSGTSHGDAPADLVILSDGDVLRLGETVLQVAIQAVEQDPGSSVSGVVHEDPLLLHEPIELRRDDTKQSWHLRQAVTVIGRSAAAGLQLDHPDVSLAHAAVFCVGRETAIIDLDSRTGFSVNGEPRALASVGNGDRVRIGPFSLDLFGGAGATQPVQAFTTDAAAGLVAGFGEPETLRDELDRRDAELERRSARLDREQHAVEAGRASLEKERAALVRQASALRETEASLEARRKSLEQREKTLRDSLLRQAQGVLGGVSPFIVAADSISDTRLTALLPPN